MSMMDESELPPYPIIEEADVLRRRRVVVGGILGFIMGAGAAAGIAYADDHFIDMSKPERDCAGALATGTDQEVADACFMTAAEDYMKRTYGPQDGEVRLIYHLDRDELLTEVSEHVQQQDRYNRGMRYLIQIVMIGGGTALVPSALEDWATRNQRSDRQPEQAAA